MNDLKCALREGDPIADEPRMSANDVQRMRAIVLAAVAQPENIAGWWPQPLVVAATIVFACGLGIIVGRRLPPLETRARVAVDERAPVRRQLQFETKGGTRVIWVINSELDLGKDPLP